MLTNLLLYAPSYLDLLHMLTTLLLPIVLPYPELFYTTVEVAECTDLVVWGTNLVSSIHYPRFSKLVMSMVSVPPYIYGVIIGLLLSDGWIDRGNLKRSAQNPRICLEQSLAHFSYFWFVFGILAHFCKSLPFLRFKVRGGVALSSLRLNTRYLPCFTEFYSLFYLDGIKIVPADIYNLLTPEALAHWIMGDGSVMKVGMTLCTDSYSVPDIVRLMNVLMIKYHLDCTLQYHGVFPRIYIKSGSMARLRTIVAPHMTPSMMYKLSPKVRTSGAR